MPRAGYERFVNTLDGLCAQALIVPARCDISSILPKYL